jgi:hypothetical protein
MFAGRSTQPGEDALYLGFDSLAMNRVEVHVTGNAYNEARLERNSWC